MTVLAMTPDPGSRAMTLERYTVERCKQLIEAQPPSMQRRVDPVWVRTLARLMERGQWQDDRRDNIMWLTDGDELIEGQHRCRAGILANRSFGAWTSRGHTVDEIKYLGQCRPRQMSATLKMVDAKEPVLASAAAKLFFNHLVGENIFAPLALTFDDFEEVTREIPAFPDWVKEARRMYSARSFRSAAPTSALLVYLIGRTMMVNAMVARRFWQQVETGADATESTLLLRNMWMNFRGKAGRLDSKIWHHNTCAKAWGWFREGAAKSKMMVPHDSLLEWR